MDKTVCVTVDGELPMLVPSLLEGLGMPELLEYVRRHEDTPGHIIFRHEGTRAVLEVKVLRVSFD